jgi:hypothetical protein
MNSTIQLSRKICALTERTMTVLPLNSNKMHDRPTSFPDPSGVIFWRQSRVRCVKVAYQNILGIRYGGVGGFSLAHFGDSTSDARSADFCRRSAIPSILPIKKIAQASCKSQVQG